MIGHTVKPHIKSYAAATYFYDSIRERNLFSAISDITSYIYGSYAGEAEWTERYTSSEIFDSGREGNFLVFGTLHEKWGIDGIAVNIVDDWTLTTTIYPPS